MFVYILIAAELAILYSVFWYLYLRAPKQSRRIVGSTWGAYNSSATAIGAAFGLNPHEDGESCAHCYLQSSDSAQQNAVKAFMLPVCDEMTLDLKTSHYVPMMQRRKTTLASLIQQLDDCLSEFNVRP